MTLKLTLVLTALAADLALDGVTAALAKCSDAEVTGTEYARQHIGHSWAGPDP